MNGPDDNGRGPEVRPYSVSEEHDPSASTDRMAIEKRNELAWRLRHRQLPKAPRFPAPVKTADPASSPYQEPVETSVSALRRNPQAAGGSRVGIRRVVGIGAASVLFSAASFAFTIDSLGGGQWWSALLQRLEKPQPDGSAVSASVVYLDPSAQYPRFAAGEKAEGEKASEVVTMKAPSELPVQLVNPVPFSSQLQEASTVGLQTQPATVLLPSPKKQEALAPAEVLPPPVRPQPFVIGRAVDEPVAGPKDTAQIEDRGSGQAVATEKLPEEKVIAVEMLPEKAVAAIEKPLEVGAATEKPPEEDANADSEVTIAAAAATGPAEPEDGASFRDCAVCPEMVVIPAGRFLMGTSAASGARPNSDESPQHAVTIAKPFALGRFEITFDDWNACVSDGGCSARPAEVGGKRGRWPASTTSWDDIKNQYLPWLSRKSGHAYRLPTEAEWEYAARGGPSAPAGLKFAFGNDDSRICEYGNVADLPASDAPASWIVSSCKDGFAETAPVGSLKPNAMNLHDMHGNVWEWVEDCWNGNYRNAPSDGSAWTEGDCSLRVVRGGSWATDVTGVRSADRGWNRPNAGSRSIGFRVARPLE